MAWILEHCFSQTYDDNNDDTDRNDDDDDNNDDTDRYDDNDDNNDDTDRDDDDDDDNNDDTDCNDDDDDDGNRKNNKKVDCSCSITTRSIKSSPSHSPSPYHSIISY